MTDWKPFQTIDQLKLNILDLARWMNMLWCNSRWQRIRSVFSMRICRSHQAMIKRMECKMLNAQIRTITSNEIRQNFLDYFVKSHDHQYVHSSSVIPPRDHGTYFTNAGMNQFKPIFLGTADPTSEMSKYRRVVNSQKCVRVGGKHNDLDDVGKDLYHHTFFEMLGNWSFADYFKPEACSMALNLLTEVYNIPRDRLYFTYFQGQPSLGLPADDECRNTWLKLGIPSERVLPCGMKDNFWDMGNTGPCGPCTEIHYDHVGNREASSLVNAGSHDVVELWNLVFMQFDRQEDGSLLDLPKQHVDTGMGLERLTAVLQSTCSNYGTDLFQPLFHHIQKCCNAPVYEGRTGISDKSGMDMAYRIVADHTRMFTVTIADGLLPGKDDLEHKLRQIMHRCMHQAHKVLHMSPGMLASLVDIVVETLGDAFPELTREVRKIKEVVNITEERYLESLERGRSSMEKLLRKLGNANSLSGKHILFLFEGRYGTPVPLDIIIDLALEKGISVDITSIDKKMQEARQISQHAILERSIQLSSSRLLFDQHTLQHLKDMGVPQTDDSLKYISNRNRGSVDNFTEAKSKICVLVDDRGFTETAEAGETCGIVLDKSCFYSESGGQVADTGEITFDGGQFVVRDVQMYQGYVLHTGDVTNGKLSLGQEVALHFDCHRREGCMRNHTATHLVHWALKQTLGNDVIRQRGSLVAPDKLSFDFSYLEAINKEQVATVESMVRKVILDNQTVYKAEMPLTEAVDIPQVATLDNQVYPSTVRVVSIGVSPQEVTQTDGVGSVEFCGGTHVDNTGALQEFCILKLTGVAQGTKRLMAVTGPMAIKAIENASFLERLFLELEHAVTNKIDVEKWGQLEKQLNKGLSEELVPKLKREEIQIKLKQLGEKIGMEQNKKIEGGIENELQKVTQEHPDDPFVVMELKFDSVKKVVKAINNIELDKPALLLSPKGSTLNCIVYFPDGTYQSSGLGVSLCEKFQGRGGPVKWKGGQNFHVVTIHGKDNIQAVLEFGQKYLSELQ